MTSSSGGAARPGDGRDRRRPRGRPGRGRRDPLRDSGNQRAVEDTAVRPSAERPRRPRATGRMAILVLVGALLVVSFASSLNAYFHQRSDIAELRAEIAQREKNIAALEKEKDRWKDPEYVAAQARERFGYQRPNEEGFVVLDENGEPLDPAADIEDDAEVDSVPTAWWETAWSSMELAGDPPQQGKR